MPVLATDRPVTTSPHGLASVIVTVRAASSAVTFTVLPGPKTVVRSGAAVFGST
jgi:hypothetical protein